MQKTGLFRSSLLLGASEPSLQAAAESAFDIALERLAEATSANEEVCTKVRRRQSSGTLKLVTVPPPPPVSEPIPSE